MRPQAAYEELLRRTREIALLESCHAVLGWDELTYLPLRGIQGRADQLAFLAGLQHDRATDRRLGELIACAAQADEARDPLTPVAVNLRELQRTYQRGLKLSRTLVQEQARLAPLAQQQWTIAREEA